ncbi:RNA polymerase sigma factor [Dokdonella sp. MW10]|uniref:RNA polymerase sigma factor n=1 Tax=Dokdonella sp. MW10 TaxID=2992926 RepID=UPI003F7D5955
MDDAADFSTDLAYARDALEGRPGAFERLVRDHQGLCWHIIERMVRHPEDARELCQETFLRVHRCLHQYRGESPLKAWIGQVAYSMAKRHLEKRRIPIAETSEGDGLDAAAAVGDGLDLQADLADAQINARLHAAIECLPPLQRTILTLYHLDEQPIGVIAGITGLAEGTIKSHLFRSRKQLRGLLEDRFGVAA